MLRLTKKTDYGLIAVKHLAELQAASLGSSSFASSSFASSSFAPGSLASSSAKDIADAYQLPTEALAKILQRLARAGLLLSQHGTKGGYVLARPAGSISVLDVIRAVDGQPAITSCSDDHSACQQSAKCNVQHPLRRINESIRAFLGSISIADLQDDMKPQARPAFREAQALEELVRIPKPVK